MKTAHFLDIQEVLTLKEDQEIHIKKGILWVTYQGDLEDHFFMAGDTLKISKNRPALIEALEKSDLEICKKSKRLSPFFSLNFTNFFMPKN